MFRKKKLIDDMEHGSVFMKRRPNPKIQKIMQEAGMLKSVEELNKYRDQPKEMTDSEGLSKAYQSKDHIYINNDTNKMYVAGSRVGGNQLKSYGLDWVQNALLIPQGLTKYHNIYKSAEQQLRLNPNIEHVIGHSSGARVANELGKQYPDLKTTSYNSPDYTSKPSTDQHLRFTTQGDIVNMFDKSGVNVKVNSLSPLTQHSFRNYGEQGSQTGRLIM